MKTPVISVVDLEHIWDKAEACLSELSEARIFITGGTGFFGCWLLESIAYAKQHFKLKTEVTVLTRDPEAFKRKAPHLANASGLSFLQGDVCDFNFPKENYTHVIHAATAASDQLNREAPMLMFDTILKGTRNMLEFSVSHGVEKFLLTSSGAIYGAQPKEMSHVEETYLGAPNNLLSHSAYGMGKRAAEHLCVLYANSYPLQVKIARCFAFVGPYLPLGIHFAIGNFMEQVLRGNPIEIKGDGTPFRSYLYAADLVIWLWTILCKGESGRAYNVGSEEALNIADLAKLVAAASKKPLEVNIAKKADSRILPERYVPSTKRASQELQLKTWVDLPAAISKTLASYHYE